MDMIADDTHLPLDIDAQPVVQAAKALQPVVREYKDEIERNQCFPPSLVKQLHAAGLYRILLPRKYGGLQADPLTYTRIAELMAQSVGSVGWNIANNGIVQLVCIGLPDEGVEEMYGDRGETVAAGTAVQGGGTAVPVEGGYRVTGRWSFGSGASEASWMLASFKVEGREGYWRGVFRKEETTILPGTWEVAGLRGTGSFDWTVDNVFLPERRTVIHAGVPLDNQWAKWPGTTYQLPVQCWVGPHHSSVITGIAQAGIDALIELAVDKTPRGRTGMLRDNPQVQESVGRAETMLNAGRSYRNEVIRDMWNTVVRGEAPTIVQKARGRLASSFAGDCARQAMDLMYRAGGSTSFKTDSRLAECWRDLQTVSQTVNVMPEWYPIGGRAIMGMDPGPRLR